MHTQDTTSTKLEYAISPILWEKKNKNLKTTTSRCGSPTCTSYRTAYDLTLNSWRFLSCQLSWCRRPWPQCRAQVTVYWSTRKTRAVATVPQVEMCPEAVVYKYTLSLSHFFGFVFGQFYQHTLVTASVRGMERREAGLMVSPFLCQIPNIWPFSILFGLRNFLLASCLFQNTSYLASFGPFHVEKLAFPWVLPLFPRHILLLFSNLIFKWSKSGEFSRSAGTWPFFWWKSWPFSKVENGNPGGKGRVPPLTKDI